MLLSLARKLERIFRENREMKETIRKLEGAHLDVKETQSVKSELFANSNSDKLSDMLC